MEDKKIAKSIWTEEDFETMQWHDCKIYAIAFDDEKFELRFDIDYIIEWVTLGEIHPHFKFWITPATLVFRNVYDIDIALFSVDFRILSISRLNPARPRNADHIKELVEYDWMFETTNGEISFKSVGYKQYARMKPILLPSQVIDFKERGGISFDKLTY